MESGTTFGDLIAVIRAALDDMESTPVTVHPGWFLEVMSGDAPGDEVEEACRSFARTGRVPAGLPDAIRLGVSLRLRCALWYCHDLAYQDLQEEPPAEAIEGILTEYWDDVGRFDWIQEDVLAADYQPPE